jgi:hypothetical protein
MVLGEKNWKPLLQVTEKKEEEKIKKRRKSDNLAFFK